MDKEKKYSANEAAIAVLSKVEELLKKSNMAKAEAKDVTLPDGEREQATPADHKGNGNPAPNSYPVNYTENYKGTVKLANFVKSLESKRSKKA